MGIMHGVTVTASEAEAKNSESEGSLSYTEFQGSLHNLMGPGFTTIKEPGPVAHPLISYLQGLRRQISVNVRPTSSIQ